MADEHGDLERWMEREPTAMVDMQDAVDVVEQRLWPILFTRVPPETMEGFKTLSNDAEDLTVCGRLEHIMGLAGWEA